MKSEREFLEDFGARRLEASAVEALLDRARVTGDIELRCLAKEVQVWRHVGPLLLDRVASASASADEGDALLKLARFLSRGEGPIADG